MSTGKKITEKILSVFLALLLLSMLNSVQAETGLEFQQPPEMGSQIPGRLEGNGTHFELNKSDYLNITLDSIEAIKLVLESIPELITIHIETDSDAVSTVITLGSLLPLTTYHKYEDDYHNHTAFTTDENGNYSYRQEISAPHLVFIQTRPSTKFINDMGGDCNLIGTWDSAIKTCTLTMDLTETIQIDSNNITLEGNGFTITGTNTGNGVYLYGRTGVTIKNLNLRHFSNGIYLYSSNNNNLTNNNANLNNYGIYLSSSSNNNLSTNNASNNIDGIILYLSSNNNILTGNNANLNSLNGIYLSSSKGNNITGNTLKENIGDIDIYAYSDSDCNNVVKNNTGSGDRPIKYFNSSINLQNEILSELILCNADNSNLGNLTIDGSMNKKNNMLYLYRTDNSIIENINSSNNYHGIYLFSSNNNNLTGINANLNNYGIYLYSSNNNNLTSNNASLNNYHGIYLYFSNNNNLTSNNASLNNHYGIYTYSSSNNTIYGNLFKNINNYGFSGSVYSNYWNITKTPGINIVGSPYLGGNFWGNSSGTGFSQTCADGNKDGICDSNYTLTSGNVDYLPLAAIPSGYGYISGTVLNGTGILGALVTTNTGNTTTSDASGFYYLFVPASAYNLTATKEPEFYQNSSVIVTAISGTTVMQDIELLMKPTGTINGTVTSV